MRERLSVIIPCKNERKNIRDCVESARPVADEIIVADSGSTDDTLDIVRHLGGCRILEHEWLGYARFKNWVIPQASYAWVLLCDADERVSTQLAAEIHRLLVHPPPEIDGYWIPRRSYFMGYRVRYGLWSRDRVCRLIRRDRCRYRDVPVHEEIDLAPQRSGQLRGELLHYTSWTYDHYLDKLRDYTRLHAEECYRRGKRPSRLGLLLRPPTRFLQSYVLRLGFLDGAVGFQVAALSAFYAFMKQARLWELHHGRRPADVRTPQTPEVPAPEPTSANADPGSESRRVA